MFEKFTSVNAGDFRQRYEGTFGFFKPAKGAKLLVKLDAITGTSCVFSDKDKVEYRLNVDAQDDIGFEFIPPKSCYYNITGEKGDLRTMLVSRVPARQFQRGLSGKNTKINMLGAGQLFGAAFSFPILESIYLKPLSPVEAFPLWQKAQEQVAISKQIALDAVSGRVFLYENLIGTFKKEGRHFSFKLSEPTLWRTEITDALRALDCTTEVA